MSPKKNLKRTSPEKNAKKVESKGTGYTSGTRAAAKIAAGPEDEFHQVLCTRGPPSG
jgi:hypothetical protein